MQLQGDKVILAQQNSIFLVKQPDIVYSQSENCCTNFFYGGNASNRTGKAGTARCT